MMTWMTRSLPQGPKYAMQVVEPVPPRAGRSQPAMAPSIDQAVLARHARSKFRQVQLTAGAARGTHDANARSFGDHGVD